MYRLITESLLGLRLEAGKLFFTPCLPADWEGFKLHYRFRETVYHISVRQVSEASMAGIEVDGVAQQDLTVSMIDDRREHTVEFRYGRPL